jgi:hypothetical protein
MMDVPRDIAVFRTRSRQKPPLNARRVPIPMAKKPPTKLFEHFRLGGTEALPKILDRGHLSN